MTMPEKSSTSQWHAPTVTPLTDPDGVPVLDSAPIRNGDIVSDR